MAIFLSKESKRFVDVSLSFEPNPVTGDLTTLVNERAINNSLKNLVLFAVTEIPFNADIGSGVGDYLFENVDEATANVIKQEIERVIKFSEPRVELVSPLQPDAADDIDRSFASQFEEEDPNYNGLDIQNDFNKRFEPIRVEMRPEQNAFMVSITYKIVGYEQIVTFNQLLEPTR